VLLRKSRLSVRHAMSPRPTARQKLELEAEFHPIYILYITVKKLQPILKKFGKECEIPSNADKGKEAFTDAVQEQLYFEC
jgi:hypothetical protein